MSRNEKVTMLFSSGDATGSPKESSVREAGMKMDLDNYVTEKDLKHLEEKTELKLDNIKTELKSDFKSIETKMEGMFNTQNERMNGIINTQNERIERLFVQQKLDMAKERKENIKWIVGTGVGIVAATAAVIAILF